MSQKIKTKELFQIKKREIWKKKIEMWEFNGMSDQVILDWV